MKKYDAVSEVINVLYYYLSLNLSENTFISEKIVEVLEQKGVEFEKDKDGTL